ncbi:DUF6069 family protein [Mumia qirimensis]|uniref:DUF6069 family protein n=1 Tax=Mumia qirimensis TaxID=3234852 RepID=UPI00351D824A
MNTIEHHNPAPPEDVHLDRSDACARSQRRKRRWYTVLVAMASANVVYTIADPLLGIDLAAQGGGGDVIQVGLLSVTLASLFAGLAGWTLLALLERVTPHARTAWTWLAIGSYLVSLAGPLGGVSASAVLAFAALHTTVAVVLIVGMRHASRP